MPKGIHATIPDLVTGQRQIDVAVASSVRARRTAKILRLFDQTPPLTREQRACLVEAAISLPVLEEASS